MMCLIFWGGFVEWSWLGILGPGTNTCNRHYKNLLTGKISRKSWHRKSWHTYNYLKAFRLAVFTITCFYCDWHMYHGPCTQASWLIKNGPPQPGLCTRGEPVTRDPWFWPFRGCRVDTRDPTRDTERRVSTQPAPVKKDALSARLTGLQITPIFEIWLPININNDEWILKLVCVLVI